MAHENATPFYPDKRAPLSCRLIGPVNIGDAATIDAVEAENDTLRAENERLKTALVVIENGLLGYRATQRYSEMRKVARAALSEAQP